jgi:hypothetical protein
MGDLMGAKADTVAAEARRAAVMKVDILIESCSKICDNYPLSCCKLLATTLNFT